jgi:predicted ribosome quality control (RQC) complex YloA/Tae2 family protein
MQWYNNAFFIGKLADELNKEFAGSRILEVFSTSKTDLFLALDRPEAIHFQIEEGFGFFKFPEFDHLPRKNRLLQFKSLRNLKIQQISSSILSRAIFVVLDDFTLVFKLFGRNTNVILYQNESFDSKWVIKGNKDEQMKLTDFSNPDVVSTFNDHLQNNRWTETIISKTIPETLQKELLAQNIQSAEQVQNFVSGLTFDTVRDDDDLMQWQMSSAGLKDGPSFIELLHRYSVHNSYRIRMARARSQALKELDARIKKRNRQLRSSMKRLQALDELDYRKNGDLIMANLHRIEKDQSKVELEDFYTGKPVEIKLQKSLSPQKNAERFYQKAKNQHKEVERLESMIEEIESELEDLAEKKHEALHTNDLKRLLKMDLPSSSQAKEIKPYRRFAFEQWEIRVGKNAKDNDELITKYAHKEDLWLHARGVKGSHVIVKSMGKEVPESVIEHAASLAAFYSKAKASEFVPVIVTTRKYVRKFKGAPPGAVKVDREEVMLAEPFNPDR